MSRDNRPTIALTTGDCTGIGPEITARILADPATRQVARLLLVADRRVVELGQRQAGVAFDLKPCTGVADADFSDDGVPIVDLENTDPALHPPGVGSAGAGYLAGETLAKAIEIARHGGIDAITFAPLNKRAMFDGGWRFPDEHKMFAHLLGHQGYFSEMNVLESWWMSRVTSHVSLREALDQITGPSIERAIALSVAMMEKAGIATPRLAVAALNPHGGEGGLFGREEIETIRPAVEAMAAKGHCCEGPFPSDTVYLKAFSGAYDGVLSMYHDQGQIATKLKGFNRGVTITAGLETVFTTPAHGTAFDIVGTGKASAEALGAAIGLAAKLAARTVQADAA